MMWRGLASLIGMSVLLVLAVETRAPAAMPWMLLGLAVGSAVYMLAGVLTTRFVGNAVGKAERELR
jgi:hypothetical protein